MAAASAAAVATAAGCHRCGEQGRHRRDCPEWPAWDAARVAVVRRVDELREERATGRRCFRGAAHAISWYAEYVIRRSSARGLPMSPDRVQASRDNMRGDVEDRKAAAVAAAIGEAEREAQGDGRSVPLRRWLLQHFVQGAGRSFAWIAELEGWPEPEVERRLKRGARLITKRLRERGWIERGRDDPTEAAA
jgi:DNA-directed RNA polymerase specialized sigma24 family protein